MHLTRRYFLQVSGSLLVGLGAQPLALVADDPVPPAEQVRRNKTLVVIFLRGGADGLNLVVPYADPAYPKLRPSLAIGSPRGEAGRAIDLDGFFGLHPRLAPLVPWFEARQAAVVHAVGHGLNTRSHFEEQDVWETGVTGDKLRADGWLNRHLASSTGGGTIRAVAIGSGLPRIFHGRAEACVISGVSDLAMPSSRGDPEKLAAALERAYRCTPGGVRTPTAELLEQVSAATLRGARELAKIAGQEYVPVIPYPENDLATKLQHAARLIKAGCGLEVVEIDYDGWDTHAGQGGADGAFADLAGGLAESLHAFMTDLGPRLDDVAIATLSDFGRTAAENGTGGTDHGWGSCMFVLGGPVHRGAGKGKVLGKWPGLGRDALHEDRDLAHTTDFRDVLAELVGAHLGNHDLARVFPGHVVAPVGVVG